MIQSLLSELFFAARDLLDALKFRTSKVTILHVFIGFVVLSAIMGEWRAARLSAQHDEAVNELRNLSQVSAAEDDSVIENKPTASQGSEAAQKPKQAVVTPISNRSNDGADQTEPQEDQDSFVIPHPDQSMLLQILGGAVEPTEVVQVSGTPESLILSP